MEKLRRAIESRTDKFRKYLEYGSYRCLVMRRHSFDKINEIREFIHSTSTGIDLHDGNVMMRGGQIVVTDPLV